MPLNLVSNTECAIKSSIIIYSFSPFDKTDIGVFKNHSKIRNIRQKYLVTARSKMYYTKGVSIMVYTM